MGIELTIAFYQLIHDTFHVICLSNQYNIFQVNSITTSLKIYWPMHFSDYNTVPVALSSFLAMFDLSN